MATALWWAWWGHRASARAVWCEKSLRWQLPVTSKCSPRSANRTPARSPSKPSRNCCARPPASRVLTRRPRAPGYGLTILTPRPRICCSLDDLLGIADPDADLPRIDPDARRRRLTALVNSASLARERPAVYIVEDVHWIDEVSESMLADFLAVIPQTPSLVVVTYRPEYRGPLAQLPGAQTVALAPLSDSETTALVSQLLGSDPSVHAAGSDDRRAGRGQPVLRRGDRA